MEEEISKLIAFKEQREKERAREEGARARCGPQGHTSKPHADTLQVCFTNLLHVSQANLVGSQDSLSQNHIFEQTGWPEEHTGGRASVQARPSEGLVTSRVWCFGPPAACVATTTQYLDCHVSDLGTWCGKCCHCRKLFCTLNVCLPGNTQRRLWGGKKGLQILVLLRKEKEKEKAQERRHPIVREIILPNNLNCCYLLLMKKYAFSDAQPSQFLWNRNSNN